MRLKFKTGGDLDNVRPRGKLWKTWGSKQWLFHITGDGVSCYFNVQVKRKPVPEKEGPQGTWAVTWITHVYKTSIWPQRETWN